VVNFVKTEEKILRFWEKEKIFEKTLALRKKSPLFVFYEGPPFANAQPGIHHILARSFKDIIVRYKTMQGYYVPRKAGWDTHGLPVEIQAEKILGLASKLEIEKKGLRRFINVCQKNIFSCKKQWEEMTKRIGYWLDLKNAYITCSNEYIESVWWLLKQFWRKGLVYQDYKVVPYCSRCGTSLSDHEVAQGYKEVEDPSIYLRFPLRDNIFGQKASLLVWTTTPWTLPANVALAISPKADYLMVKADNEFLILAKERLSALRGKYQTVKKIKGKRLVGLKYLPPFESNFKQSEKAFVVLAGDFVRLDEGTGVVHMAPAFGAEDLELAKNQKLPVILNVGPDGCFTKEVKKWAGRFVKDVEDEIISELEKRHLIYKKESIRHSYPFCWRCDTPLLYYAKNSWYIKTTAVKDKMLNNNSKVSWYPSYIKNGRFGNWLKENVDWAISRERYWGTPIPIWLCQGKNKENKNDCGKVEVIGSLEELQKLSLAPIDLKKIDLHRPSIDKIILKCPECGGKMKRVPEVLDCWFDSGAMPFAQMHFPFETKSYQLNKLQNPTQKEIKQLVQEIPFPADFIAEGIDQTRGWFYTLLAISTLLGLESPYKNVLSLGLVLDEKGKKMSKSKGNIIIPREMIDKYGADSIRLYFFLCPLGETVRFSEKNLAEVFRKFIITLYNSFVFYQTYANNPAFSKKEKAGLLLDKWVFSKLNQLIKKMTIALDNYQITTAARLLYQFVVDDFSNWYLRRSRKRRTSNFFQTFETVLLELCRLSAPFTPFIAEEIYQRMSRKNKSSKKSVHLESWPQAEERFIQTKLTKEMEVARKICQLGLSVRTERKIRVRQPLSEIKVASKTKKLNKELSALILEEINVKKLSILEEEEWHTLDKDWVRKEEEGIKIALNVNLTPQLIEEGLIREIVRHIQDFRKRCGFSPNKEIFTFWQTDETKLLNLIIKHQSAIESETKCRLSRNDLAKNGTKIELAGSSFWIKERGTKEI